MSGILFGFIGGFFAGVIIYEFKTRKDNKYDPIVSGFGAFGTLIYGVGFSTTFGVIGFLCDRYYIK